VHYDGETCSLLLGGRAISGYGHRAIADCLDKTVRIVSDKGFVLFMRLEKFEDPC
jgi:hypothetical protein